MKKILLLILIVFLFNIVSADIYDSKEWKQFLKNKDKISQKYKSGVQTFTQRVDHYDPLNNSTYQQRYRVITPSSTQNITNVFIYLAGEAPMEFFEFQEVFPIYWANKYNSVYITLEHRYYGESIPTSDYSTKNMRFLSANQALADAAHFIVSYNSTIKNPGKWIVFGCSYAGALSSFMRVKYPQLVYGSVDASGPVEAQLDFSSYYSLFQKVVSPSCLNASINAINQVSQMLLTQSGRNELGALFNSCAPIGAVPNSQNYFLLSLTSALGASDQYDNPPLWPLETSCNIMTSSTNYLQNLAKVFVYANTPSGCNDFNENSSFITPMQNVTNQNRSWYFQKCTEFGYFKPTGLSIFWPGRITLQHHINWCKEIFGFDMDLNAPNWTNTVYGGSNLVGTNLIVTNGLHDPWHQLSILDNRPGVLALTYEAGHCGTFTASTPNDPNSLTQARQKIENTLQNWLHQN